MESLTVNHIAVAANFRNLILELIRQRNFEELGRLKVYIDDYAQRNCLGNKAIMEFISLSMSILGATSNG